MNSIDSNMTIVLLFVNKRVWNAKGRCLRLKGLIKNSRHMIQNISKTITLEGKFNTFAGYLVQTSLVFL